jgi:hypothetical protein
VSDNPIALLVTSGACITPSHELPEEVIVSPLSGNEREAPVEVRLKIVSDPLLVNVTPVEVEPLKNIELVVVIDQVEVLVSITNGVLKCIVGEGSPHCHFTRKKYSVFGVRLESVKVWPVPKTVPVWLCVNELIPVPYSITPVAERSVK